jgi:hypothetical protein
VRLIVVATFHANQHEWVYWGRVPLGGRNPTHERREIVVDREAAVQFVV